MYFGVLYLSSNKISVKLHISKCYIAQFWKSLHLIYKFRNALYGKNTYAFVFSIFAYKIKRSSTHSIPIIIEMWEFMNNEKWHKPNQTKLKTWKIYTDVVVNELFKLDENQNENIFCVYRTREHLVNIW